MDYIVKQILNKDAKQLITLYHYSHTWTSCKYALGLIKNDTIIGVAVYGHPVGRMVGLSISTDIESKNILELTRLWIADSEGKNTESWFLGKTFRWLKDHDSMIKVLISYSDPNAGHYGAIYQATNWLYQGRGTDALWYSVKGELLHPRTVFQRYGTRAMDELKKIVPEVELITVDTKLRYIYLLGNKREKKKIMKELYHPVLPYEKFERKKNESVMNKEEQHYVKVDKINEFFEL